MQSVIACGIIYGKIKNELNMKTETFENASKNIQKQIIQSVKKQIPTLDYIMQVDKMSPEDRVFYEAYKKYGNRNHTWQDFKAMFNGDTELMQSTVKNWRTWDELNTIYTKFYRQHDTVYKLVNKYGIKEINMDNYQQYKDKFPDLVQEYEKLLALKNGTYTNYSTFNIEVSKIEKQFEKEMAKIVPDDEESKNNLITKYIKTMSECIDLRNGDFVAGERLEAYKNIILSNPQILNMAKNFKQLTETEVIQFAKLILDASGQKFGTSGPVKKDKKNSYTPSTQTITLSTDFTEFKYPLANFLASIVHEDNHRIDYQNPKMGMIDNQVMLFQEKYYMSPDQKDLGLYTAYRYQPTEQASFYQGSGVGIGLYLFIKSQNAPDR